MTIDVSNAAGTRPQVGDRLTRRKVAALLLALVAGFVNAVVALVLLDLSISHITGDSEDLSIALSRLHVSVIVQMGTPIATFFLGIAIGGAVMEIAVRRQVRRRLALMLTLEALLIAGFVLSAAALGGGHRLEPGSHLGLLWLIGLPAGAMGIQTSALDQIRGRRVRTTYLSGMVTRLAHAFVRWVFWIGDRAVGERRSFGGVLRESRRLHAFDRWVFLAGIWLMWAGGAASGAAAELRFGAVAVGLPLAVLALVIAMDVWHPFEFPSPLPQEPDPRADLLG